jgi:hypothetical protein
VPRGPRRSKALFYAPVPGSRPARLRGPDGPGWWTSVTTGRGAVVAGVVRGERASAVSGGAPPLLPAVCAGSLRVHEPGRLSLRLAGNAFMNYNKSDRPPGAQTKPRGRPRPVRRLLGGTASPARLFSVLGPSWGRRARVHRVRLSRTQVSCESFLFKDRNRVGRCREPSGARPARLAGPTPFCSRPSSPAPRVGGALRQCRALAGRTSLPRAPLAAPGLSTQPNNLLPCPGFRDSGRRVGRQPARQAGHGGRIRPSYPARRAQQAAGANKLESQGTLTEESTCNSFVARRMGGPNAPNPASVHRASCMTIPQDPPAPKRRRTRYRDGISRGRWGLHCPRFGRR